MLRKILEAKKEEEKTWKLRSNYNYNLFCTEDCREKEAKFYEHIYRMSKKQIYQKNH